MDSDKSTKAIDQLLKWNIHEVWLINSSFFVLNIAIQMMRK